MSELYDSVDYNNLNFEYIGPTKDVSFYEYKDSKELFNSIKYNQISYDNAVKRQKELLNELSNIKIGKKTQKQRKTIYNLEKIYNSREETINVLEIMEKWSLMQPTNQNKMKLREKDLKY